MAWLPVGMTVGAGLRAEELIATPHGGGFLNGAGTAGAGALKQNCCHGCLREGPFRSMPVALQGAEGTADLRGTVSGSFQAGWVRADSQVFFISLIRITAGQHIDRVAVVTDAGISAGQHDGITIVGVGLMKANSNRCQDLNKQLAMYRAFRDMDGVAAVTRELQMDACACPVRN